MDEDQCLGMKNPQGLYLLSVLALASIVSKTGGSSLPSPVLTGPDMAYLGSKERGRKAPVSGAVVTPDPRPPILYEGARLALRCDVISSSQLSYTWFFNRQDVTSSLPSTPLLQPVGNMLVVEKVTERHAGNYSCMAETRIKEGRRFSSSREVRVFVKVYLSVPKISFTISKEGLSYRGNVTCRSLRGSPPVTFHLFLDDKEVGSIVATEALVAWFPVAMVPGQDMGVARCEVESERQQLTSQPLTLDVVPVGGSARVEVDHLYKADSKMSAIRLQCLLTRGTFPSFSWFLNGSQLHPNGASQVLADHGHTLLLNQLGPEESGYYHCRAKDSYDDTSTWVESETVLVQVTGDTDELSEVTIVSIEAIAISFCCFLLLALAVGVGCVMRMLDCQQGNLNRSENPDALPLSDIISGSEVKQMDTSSVGSDVQDQTLEITI